MVVKKNIDFLSMGFEKRFLTYERMTKMYQYKKLSRMKNFTKQLNYVLNLFNDDSSYKAYKQMAKKIKTGLIQSSREGLSTMFVLMHIQFLI